MNITSLVKILARYGAFAGVIGFGLLLGLYYMGKHPLLIYPIFDFRIILLGVFIFFGLKEYRDYHQEGVLYFWQGLIGSFVLTVVFAAVASLLIFGFGSLNAEFVQDYVAETTKYLKELMENPEVDQAGKELIQRNLIDIPATTIGNLANKYLVQSFIISFFISIILSVVLRRQPKP